MKLLLHHNAVLVTRNRRQPKFDDRLMQLCDALETKLKAASSHQEKLMSIAMSDGNESNSGSDRNS